MFVILHPLVAILLAFFQGSTSFVRRPSNQLLKFAVRSQLVDDSRTQEEYALAAKETKKQYDFEEIIAEASKTKIYTHAVHIASEYINKSPELSATAVTSVIKIFGLAGLVDDAVGVLRIAKGRGLNLNVHHINAAMNVCKRHKRYDATVQLFDETFPTVLSPNLCSISSVIVAFGELKKWERALEVFETYSDQRTRDLIVYSSLLSALAKSNQIDVMFKVFEEAERAHLSNRIRLTAQIFTVLISACGKVGRWQEAEAFYSRMQVLSVPADKIATFTVIRVCYFELSTILLELLYFHVLIYTFNEHI